MQWAHYFIIILLLLLFYYFFYLASLLSSALLLWFVCLLLINNSSWLLFGSSWILNIEADKQISAITWSHYCCATLLYVLCCVHTDMQPCILKGHQQPNTSTAFLSFCVKWSQLCSCLITLMKKGKKRRKKTWLWGIRVKPIMNYGWISLRQMKFCRVKLAGITVFTESEVSGLSLTRHLGLTRIISLHNVHNFSIIVSLTVMSRPEGRNAGYATLLQPHNSF